MSRPLGLLAISAIFAVLTIGVSPERLIAAGVLDRSLTSSIPIVRETAQLEIVLARYLAGAAALLSFLAWIALPWLARSRWYQGILRNDARFPAAYEEHQSRFLTVTGLIAMVFVLAGALYIARGDVLFDIETLRLLNREDGILESVSALLLLAAAGMALWVALHTDRMAVRFGHLFLALLFFAMCGEEISWGQRIFEFSTPEALKEINVQQEVNLHNMFGYLFDHLFILLFFVWGCVVPLMYWNSKLWRWGQSGTGLPFPSVGLAVAMLLVTLMQDQLTNPLLGKLVTLRVAELRELLSALCFLLMTTESLRLAGRERVRGLQSA